MTFPRSATTWRFLALATITLVAYWPALHAGFIWDDDILLTNNPLVKAPDGLARMWLTTQAVDYWPVTGTSFWLEWRLWGMDASGYHVSNVLQHLANACLLWAILFRLGFPYPWLAASLFAVHPVNVESVAWITQRKNTLSMFFALLAVFSYLASEPDAPSPGDDRPRARAKPSRRETGPSPPRTSTSTRLWYAGSIVAFALGMLAKGSVAVVPGVLWLIAWWKRGRVSRRDLVRTLPLIVCAVVLTLVNIWFQDRGGASAVREAAFLERALGAGAALWFYLSKAVAPVNLMFVYPLWDIRVDEVRWWLPLLLAIGVTTVLLAYGRHPVGRALLFGWAFFALALLPVLGFADIYYMKFSLVADHYQYLSLVAVAAGTAALFWVARRHATVTRVGAAALLVLLAGVSWKQTRLYADARTLYVETIRVNPGAWLARNNLALIQMHESPRDLAGALEQLRAAIAIAPGEASLHNNLGAAYFQSNRFAEAAAAHAQAIRLDPRSADAHSNLGANLLKLGRHQEAVTAYREALRLNPNLDAVRPDLAAALEALGRAEEAARELHAAAANVRSGTAESHAASADALMRLGRVDEAIEQYRQAVVLDPGAPGVRSNLGLALSRARRYQEAEEHLRIAVRLRPQDAAARNNLGNVLQATNRLDEALAEFEIALQHAADSDKPLVHNDTGIVLARLGRLAEAIGHFEQALKLKPDFAAAAGNLAKARALGAAN